MSIRHLEKFFQPQSVVLIGASHRGGSIGNLLLRNLRRGGFAGRLYFVNIKAGAIDGLTIYPDVASLPEVPDLAVIATPPDTIPEIVAALGERGVRAAVVITAGFAERGAAGKALQQAVLEAARPHLLRLIGPNCLGIMAPRVGLDASFSHIAARTGDIALVSQSGAIVTAMLDWAAPRGIGFSHVVSLGDMADVDVGDMLDYLALDTGTRAVLLYVEGITHGRKFMSAARACARAKPVLVLKAGRSPTGARAASSHTGALAGSDAVYDYAFRRAGLLRVHDMGALFDATETLALTRRQDSARLTIVSNGGGAGVLAADALETVGGVLAPLDAGTLSQLDKALPVTWSRSNPIDLVGDATGARYTAVLDALNADPHVDAVLLLNCPTALADPDETARAVVDWIAARPNGSGRARNIFTAWLGGQSAEPARRRFLDAGIPTYETPEAAVAGFMHRVRYQENQALLMEAPPARSFSGKPDRDAAQRIIEGAIANGREWLMPDEVASILTAYAVPQPLCWNAETPEEAARVASAIGFPVALKIRSPDITHKTDVGGIALRLTDAESVRQRAATMLAQVRAARPQARLDGFSVQQMVDRPEATELLIGLAQDAVFGPVLVFGHGGVAVEVLRDSAVALPPLNLLLARAQMNETRVWRLLQGYRGKPPAAIEDIADLLIRIGDMAIDHPAIQELDINPLLADATGVVALDARIRVVSVAERGNRLAIAPYPAEWEKQVTLSDRTALQLRPIRPEDEPLLHDLVAHMSPDDVRLRFLSPMRGLSHSLAARLTQIDYDREMALLALKGEVLVGIARYFADPDRERAEFAIAVRSDWHHRGVGSLLMARLIEIARQAGIGELFGLVFRENAPMLDLCHELGFQVEGDPQDASLMRVRKSLSHHNVEVGHDTCQDLRAASPV